MQTWAATIPWSLHRLFSTRTGRPSVLLGYRGHTLSRMLFERGGKPRRHEHALMFVVNTNAECLLPKIITRGRCCDFRLLLPRLS